MKTIQDAVFIKNGDRYTPMWLVAENREWYWHIVVNVVLDLSETDLREIFVARELTINCYNGRSISGERGLNRWVDNRVKKAKTVSEIISENDLGSIYAKVLVVQNGQHTNMLSTRIHTDEEFADWVSKAKIAALEKVREGAQAGFSISFPTKGKLKKPVASAPEVFGVYVGNLGYVTAMAEDGTPSGFSANIRNAKVFYHGESQAKVFRRQETLSKAQFFPVSEMLNKKPYNVVFRAETGICKGQYYATRNRGGVVFTPNADEAKHFPDELAAKRVIAQAAEGAKCRLVAISV